MINCFIPFLSLPQARQTVRALGLCDRIKNIYLLATEKIPDEVEGCEMLMIDSPASTATFRTIALHADTAYTLLYTKYTAFEPGQFAFERLLAIAGDTNAGMLYADRYLLKNGNSQQAPVIDYQKGSLRDDFDFGSLLFFRSSVLKQAVRAMDADYRLPGCMTFAFVPRSWPNWFMSMNICTRKWRRISARAERSCSIMLIRKTGRCRSRWKLFVRPI